MYESRRSESLRKERTPTVILDCSASTVPSSENTICPSTSLVVPTASFGRSRRASCSLMRYSALEPSVTVIVEAPSAAASESEDSSALVMEVGVAAGADVGWAAGGGGAEVAGDSSSSEPPHEARRSARMIPAISAAQTLIMLSQPRNVTVMAQVYYIPGVGNSRSIKRSGLSPVRPSPISMQQGSIQASEPSRLHSTKLCMDP